MIPKSCALTVADIHATLIRSKRKSLGLMVRDGEVIIRAPARAPINSIQAFVQQKLPWIRNHLHQQQQKAAANARAFKSGEIFFWLGEPLTLSLARGGTIEVRRQDNNLQLICPNPSNVKRVRHHLEAWYKREALVYLNERVACYEKHLQVHAKGLKVRRYKARWGSCNHRHEIQINWLLLMAPAKVVDYVVVHELCHIRHFNHSKAFWRMVESAYPTYATERQWLHQQTHIAWPEHD